MALPSDKRAKTLKRGEPDSEAREKLNAWREMVHARDHPIAQYDETGVLPDDLIAVLVSHGPLSSEQVADSLKSKWLFWEKHGVALASVMEKLDVKFKPLPTKPRRTAKNSTTGTVNPNSANTQPEAPVG